MIVKLLTEHHLEFLSLKEGCRGSSKSTLVKCQIVGNLMPRLSIYVDILGARKSLYLLRISLEVFRNENIVVVRACLTLKAPRKNASENVVC